jgi:hypothetical protein
MLALFESIHKQITKALSGKKELPLFVDSQKNTKAFRAAQRKQILSLC